jgi:hypothetical protein
MRTGEIARRLAEIRRSRSLQIRLALAFANVVGLLFRALLAGLPLIRWRMLALSHLCRPPYARSRATAQVQFRRGGSSKHRAWFRLTSPKGPKVRRATGFRWKGDRCGGRGRAAGAGPRRPSAPHGEARRLRATRSLGPPSKSHVYG